MQEDIITKKMQDIEFEMLNEIKSIFEKNNIKYFLACGTLLGAVRHSDFIPWDDDVDIYCFPGDLDRIKECISRESKNLKYVDGLCEKNYPYWFPKIINTKTVLKEKSLINQQFSSGVYIDIFPLMESSINKKIERKRYFYYGIIRSRYLKPCGMKYVIMHYLSFLLSIQRVQKRLYKLYNNHSEDSLYYIDTGKFGEQSILKKEWFGDQLIYFRKNSFSAPRNYQDYLTHYYGDYMSLPPVDKRVSNHNFDYLKIGEEVLKGEK